MITDADPFDLPDWLGDAEVTWSADSGVRTGHDLRGELRAEGQPVLACDLLAVDQAYPAPVTDDAVRMRAHQAWRHDQVLVIRRDDRLALAVPGTAFTADLIMEAVGRLAKAVGSSGERYAVRLRIGEPNRRNAGPVP